MDIKTYYIPQITIEKFAEQFGLVMEVHERSKEENDPGRYYAYFAESHVKGDGIVIGTFGNGPTPEAAIKNYGRRINLCILVFNAFDKHKRYEIQVPRLTGLEDV